MQFKLLSSKKDEDNMCGGFFKFFFWYKLLFLRPRRREGQFVLVFLAQLWNPHGTRFHIRSLESAKIHVLAL